MVAEEEEEKEEEAAVVGVLQFSSPIKRVLMLQHSLYRHSTFISTSKVPMQEEFNPAISLQQFLSDYSPSASQPPSLQQPTSFTLSLSIYAGIQDHPTDTLPHCTTQASNNH